MQQLELRQQVLETAGHEVALALSPADALQSAPGWAQLIMIDLRFLNAAGEPDCREGLALIRRLREQSARVPVVVLSGWPDDIYGRSEETMVSRVMMKPVATKELLEAIEQLV